MTENHNLLLGVVTGAAISMGAAYFFRTPENSNNNSSRGKYEFDYERGQRSETILDQMNNDDCAIRKGFSMQEAMEHNTESVTRAKGRTPKSVMHALQRGNTRFWMGVAKRPEVSAFQRRGLIAQQHPSVAILGCADSRVPIEIIFDQGLGDIFTIRVAGNYLDTSTEGSLEYAVCHLNVKVLIIMGHEGCGAVDAARSSEKDLEAQPKCLCDLLKSIKSGLDDARLKNIYDEKAGDREAVVSNVKHQVAKLMENKAVKESVEKGELIVAGAFYNQSSGIVDFLPSD